MDDMTSGIPNRSRPSFAASHVPLAMLLQCAPLLCAAGSTEDAVFSHLAAPNPAGFQVLSLSALFAGVGYAALGRRARFRCAALLGAGGFWALQLPGPTVRIAVALLLVALVAVTTADARRWRRGGDVSASPVGVVAVAGTIAACSALAWVMVAAAALTLALLTCSTDCL
jgi:hypothetical protein